MKKYQKLRSENLKVAKSIARTLKQTKCISKYDMEQTILKGKKMPPCFVLPNNFKTIYQFLSDHDIVTRETINGLVVYVATRKLTHTNIENLFIEVSEICQTQISEAQKWVKNNKGLIPLEVEAKFVGERYLELPSHTLNQFIKNYIDYNKTISQDTNYMMYTIDDKNYYKNNSVYYVQENMVTIKLIK